MTETPAWMDPEKWRSIKQCLRGCDVECIWFYYAWTANTDSLRECRRMHTRPCPLICDTLDGICARFELPTQEQAKFATYNLCQSVADKGSRTDRNNWRIA